MNINPKPKPIKREKSKPRKKKTSRQIIEKKLDELVREIVLARDHACVCPSPEKGHSDVRQCGHLFTRSKKSVRWSLVNCQCQCSSCNLLHEFNPHRYVMSFIHKFGLCKYQELYRDAETPSLLKTYELEELYEQLSVIRERQKNEPEWLPYFSQKDIISGAWMVL